MISSLNNTIFEPLATLQLSKVYQTQWHLHGRGSFGTETASVNAEKAWVLLNGFGSSDVVIGFADDGCLMSAVDSDPSAKFVAGAFLENGKLESGSYEKVHSKMFIRGHRHGTALAGLVAAPISNNLPVGVAPGCRLLPVRWEYNGHYKINQEDFHKILIFIADKVDIFLNTWASFPNMNFSENNLILIRQLARSGGRRGKGILFVWASGNSNCPIHFSGEELIAYSGSINDTGEIEQTKFSSRFVHALSNIDNVLLTAAVSSTKRRAHYSCYGPGISVSAPSNNSHCFNAIPFQDPGLTTRSADFCNFTQNFKGTSGSAALVAGVAGLLISAHPSLTASELAQNIKMSASKNLDLTPYPDLHFPMHGKSLPVISDAIAKSFELGGFDSKGWSPWFGYGLVDAWSAIGKIK